MSITGVVTACNRRAQFAVLRVDGRNVGVFAGTGFVDRRGAIWTGVEFGSGNVEVWYQRGERSVSCHASATGGGDVAVLPRVGLGGQEGGMLGRKAGGTVGGYRQVCVLMVVSGVEGFTWWCWSTAHGLEVLGSGLTKVC